MSTYTVHIWMNSWTLQMQWNSSAASSIRRCSISLIGTFCFLIINNLVFGKKKMPPRQKRSQWDSRTFKEKNEFFSHLWSVLHMEGGWMNAWLRQEKRLTDDKGVLDAIWSEEQDAGIWRCALKTARHWWKASFRAHVNKLFFITNVHADGLLFDQY